MYQRARQTLEANQDPKSTITFARRVVEPLPLFSFFAATLAGLHHVMEPFRVSNCITKVTFDSSTNATLIYRMLPPEQRHADATLLKFNFENIFSWRRGKCGIMKN